MCTGMQNSTGRMLPQPGLPQQGFRCPCIRLRRCGRRLAAPPERAEVALKQVDPSLWHSGLNVLQGPALGVRAWEWGRFVLPCSQALGRRRSGAANHLRPRGSVTMLCWVWAFVKPLPRLSCGRSSSSIPSEPPSPPCLPPTLGHVVAKKQDVSILGAQHLHHGEPHTNQQGVGPKHEMSRH